MPIAISQTAKGMKGGTKARARERSAQGRPLTVQQEAFARCIAVYGMTGVEAYRASYNVQSMSDAACASEASRLKSHPRVAGRIRAIVAEQTRTDLHDAAASREFVLAGLKRLALNGDNSSAQLRAYELIGKLTHVRLFDAPSSGQIEDNRDAQTLREQLEGRLRSLLPAPDASEGE
jgi:hypothetical protein